MHIESKICQITADFKSYGFDMPISDISFIQNVAFVMLTVHIANTFSMWNFHNIVPSKMHTPLSSTIDIHSIFCDYNKIKIVEIVFVRLTSLIISN